MYTTSKEVQRKVYTLLKGSELAQAVSGKLYHDTTRPRGSQSEDIVVRYTAGLAGEIDDGVVTILIYSNPLPASDGTPREDIRRTEELERLATQWAHDLTPDDYLFTLSDTTATHYDPDIKQYFTSIRLKYRHY